MFDRNSVLQALKVWIQFSSIGCDIKQQSQNNILMPSNMFFFLNLKTLVIKLEFPMAYRHVKNASLTKQTHTTTHLFSKATMALNKLLRRQGKKEDSPICFYPKFWILLRH